jgi:hypothetical protein
MRIGYYANPKSYMRTKTHWVKGNKPLCGVNIKNKEFQWCSNDRAEYIECKSCQKIWWKRRGIG